MLTLVNILILIIVPACTWWFGLWSNLLNLVNLLLAGLIATSIYHPVANRIAGIDPASYGYLSDFIALWIVFVISFVVLRGVTDLVSKYQLKFDPITEMAGRSVLALLLGFGMMCFTSFTLNLAPLPPSLYSAETLDQAKGSIPDRIWLGYASYASVGPLAASKSKNMLFQEYTLDKALQLENVDSRLFAPQGSFFESGWWLRQSIEREKKRRKESEK